MCKSISFFLTGLNFTLLFLYFKYFQEDIYYPTYLKYVIIAHSFLYLFISLNRSYKYWTTILIINFLITLGSIFLIILDYRVRTIGH